MYHTIRPDEAITRGSIHVEPCTVDEVKLDSPYKAKDDIKSLDPETTGRHWDSQYWRVDLSAVVETVQHLRDCGYVVEIHEDVVEAFQRNHPDKARELA